MTEIYCMHFHRGFFPLRCAFTANYFPLGWAFTNNMVSDSEGAPFYRGLLAVGSAKANGILNSNRDLYSAS